MATKKMLGWASSSQGEHLELCILLHGCCLWGLHRSDHSCFVCRRAPVSFQRVTPFS